MMLDVWLKFKSDDNELLDDYENIFHQWLMKEECIRGYIERSKNK